jgi:hypothetical protein
MTSGQQEYKPLLQERSWSNINSPNEEKRTIQNQIRLIVPLAKSKLNPQLRLAIALFIILGMVASWITMAELLQSVQKSSSTKFEKVLKRTLPHHNLSHSSWSTASRDLDTFPSFSYGPFGI